MRVQERVSAGQLAHVGLRPRQTTHTGQVEQRRAGTECEIEAGARAQLVEEAALGVGGVLQSQSLRRDIAQQTGGVRQHGQRQQLPVTDRQIRDHAAPTTRQTSHVVENTRITSQHVYTFTTIR